jgi:hypothetical protein
MPNEVLFSRRRVDFDASLSKCRHLFRRISMLAQYPSQLQFFCLCGASPDKVREPLKPPKSRAPKTTSLGPQLTRPVR